MVRCYKCGRVARYHRIGCREDPCPWQLYYGDNRGVDRMANKHLDAIYKKRIEIDDTISTPEEYREFCGRIDDLANDIGEKTFKEWRETHGDD